MTSREEVIPTSNVREFQVGDKVYARDYSHNGNKWLSATITQVTGPVSYVIKLTDGSVMRRHVDQLRIRRVEDNTDKSTEVEDFGPTLTPIPNGNATNPIARQRYNRNHLQFVVQLVHQNL